MKNFFKKKFPVFNQHDSMDCGPTCLRMICKYYGKEFSLDTLMKFSNINRDGISLQGVADIAESVGFRSLAVKVDYDQLLDEVPLPAVAFWKQNHFVVVYSINKSHVVVADPRSGLIKYNTREFINGWTYKSLNNREGFLVLLEPTDEFYNKYSEKKTGFGWSFFKKYFKPYKFYLVQIFISLLLGSAFQLLLPFLTQAIFDYGIKNNDVNYIYVVILAQIIIFVASTALSLIRSWIVINISTRINISILSDFLIKIMKLPISFFDSKWTGDIMQRIRDHKKIENFLSDSLLTSLFSLFTIFIFGTALAFYNLNIFLIFLFGSIINVFWLLLFLDKRKMINNKMFAQLAADQNNILQLINGMQEIKLNNIEILKRWEWERIQSALFKIQIKDLGISQVLNGGSTFFNYIQTMSITFYAAISVMNGSMSIGEMIAVIFIVGQISGPMSQIISFIQSAQDAKISVERLLEMYDKDEEAPKDVIFVENLPLNRTISLNNVSFKYPTVETKYVLNNINISIPHGKVTAIVGSSGSGKTTLLKLLLQFYKPSHGNILIDNVNLNDLNPNYWRSQCGVVMQDGFIFSDSIAKNIAMQDKIDVARLEHSITVANISSYIDDLPLGYNTVIGQDGIGLSQGQRQRLLIARSIYKNPKYIFFDEATNSLDANNELVIINNLNKFFMGRTVIIVAHRLSTVKNADQIIVMNDGKIVEYGTHKTLSENKSYYFNLVKNQLELGNN